MYANTITTIGYTSFEIPTTVIADDMNQNSRTQK